MVAASRVEDPLVKSFHIKEVLGSGTDGRVMHGVCSVGLIRGWAVMCSESIERWRPGGLGERGGQLEKVEASSQRAALGVIPLTPCERAPRVCGRVPRA